MNEYLLTAEQAEIFRGLGFVESENFTVLNACDILMHGYGVIVCVDAAVPTVNHRFEFKVYTKNRKGYYILDLKSGCYKTMAEAFSSGITYALNSLFK